MSHTLLINADYTPLAVVSWKRAMIMVLDDKVDVLEADEVDVIRSPSAEWPRPKVVRLRVMAKIPWKARVALNKKNLYQRDKGMCAYCEKQIGISSATIDHVKPRSRGGRNDWTNTVLACGKCNFTKGNKLLSELGWSLKFKPEVPKRQGVHILIGYVEEPSWEPYLTAFAT